MMRTILFGDWGTKLQALVMAVLLWSYLYWQRHTQVEKPVPVEVTFTHADVFDVRPIDAEGRPIRRITLLVNAERSLADELDTLDVRCKVALPDSAFSEAERGRHTVTLAQANIVNLPGSVTVRFVPSPELTVEYVKWTIPPDPVAVRAGAINDPAPGYRRGRVKIVPDGVRVRIPAGSPPPEFLELPPIDVGVKRRSYQLTTRPQVPKGVELVDGEVVVDIEILPEIQSKTIRPKVQVVWEAWDDRFTYRVTRQDARVELKGTLEELEKFTDESVLVLTVTVELVQRVIDQNFTYIEPMNAGLRLQCGDAIRLLEPAQLLDDIRIEFSPK